MLATLCASLFFCACDSRDRTELGAAVDAPPASSQSQGQTPLQEETDHLRRVRIESLRRAADKWEVAPRDTAALFGADPYALLAVRNGQRAIGLLRGRNQSVLLDHRARELARLSAPARPSALAPAYSGAVWIVSQNSGRLQLVQYSNTTLQSLGTVDIDGLSGVRSLLRVGQDSLLVTEEQFGRLVRLSNGALVQAARTSPPSKTVKPVELARYEGLSFLSQHRQWCLVNSLLEGRVRGYRCQALAEQRLPRISWQVEHDGPIWSTAAWSKEGVLWLFLGGVEDKPLDRTIGSFGNIDSFLYAYQVSEGVARRVAEFNLSQLGVLTPKTIEVTGDVTGSLVLTVTGYAAPTYATLGFDLNTHALSTLARDRPWWPGAAAVATLEHGSLFANPLLDGWMSRSTGSTQFVRADDDLGHLEARLGETLAFTELMARGNSFQGPLSRFTCETCHFEGHADGRTHHTGRDDVRATTKPLFGLSNNAPHFSRALDDDLAEMVHNEFEAINAGNDRSPWFGVTVQQEPWLMMLDPRIKRSDRLSPLRLRSALMRFFFESRSEPPLGKSTGRWDPQQRRGAALFAEHCETCHQARYDTRGEERVPYDAWEAQTTGEARELVWALNEYRRTGVVPYVHPKGARVPSLRRLYKKRPYFTNGSARTLQQVLEEFTVAPGGAEEGMHKPPEHVSDDKHLPAHEVASLLAFVRLL